MTELEDLARVREFVATLEHGDRIECRLTRKRDRKERNIITPLQAAVILALSDGEKTTKEIALRIGRIRNAATIATCALSALGIAETDGRLWRLTEFGASIVTHSAAK